MEQSGQMISESINGIGPYAGVRDGREEGKERGFEVVRASGSKRTRGM
jgi:hypothetical protein